MARRKKQGSPEIRRIKAKSLMRVRAEARVAIAAASRGNCAAAGKALLQARLAGSNNRKAFPALRRAHAKVHAYCPKIGPYSR